MRHFKVLGIGLLAMFGVLAFAITTTSSAATVTLPDVHVLSTGTYPLHLSFSDNKPTATKLSNELGGELEGTGLLLLFLIFGLSSLGSFEVLFLKVLEPKTGNSCITSGDKSGEVLIKGSFHVVPTEPRGEPAVLYLYAPFKLTCGPKTFKVSGSVLTPARFKSGSTELEGLTEACGVSEGNGSGVAKVREYINDNGTKVVAVITSELGEGEGESALEVEGEVCPEALKTSSGLVNTFQVLQR
jgi:hypothetical protein